MFLLDSAALDPFSLCSVTAMYASTWVHGAVDHYTSKVTQPDLLIVQVWTLKTQKEEMT